jgi:hypothetical protein
MTRARTHSHSFSLFLSLARSLTPSRAHTCGTSRYSPPITSLYSQVFWTGLDPVDLPADIVKRYDGVGMAVVGFEVDQVRKGAGPNGEDISLPINVACESRTY